MKDKSPSRTPHYLALPGSGEWELWQMDAQTGPERLRVAPDCGGLQLPLTAKVALPSSEWIFFADHYAAGEDEMIADMVFLQMESRGMTSRDKSQTVWDHRVVEKREKEILVTSACLGEGVESLRDVNHVSAVTGSFEVWNFPNSAITLWRELGRWNCAVRNGDVLVAAQRLGNLHLDSDLASEVLCLLAELEVEKLAEKVEKLVVWDSGDRNFSDAFSCLSLPVSTENRPEPTWPETAGNLLPFSYREKILHASRKEQFRKIGIGVAALVALGFFVVLIQTVWLWSRTRQIDSFLQRSAAEVDGIRGAAARWDAVASGLEGDRSALEVFYRCARNLPAHGVHFTLFYYKPSQIVIVGEADNVHGVVEFQGKLSADKELAEYQWKIPPPRILPNNVARFEITGNRPSNEIVQNTE